MSPSSRKPIVFLLGVVLSLWAFGDDALAQFGGGQDPRAGKKHGGKGSSSLVGKKSRLDGSVYENGQNPARNPDGSIVPRTLLIRLGDRVLGRIGNGQTHRITFEAVKGTRIDLVLAPTDSRLALASRLLGSGDTPLSVFRRRKSDPSVLFLNDYLLGSTGVYTVEVALPANQSGDYVLTTSGDYPASREEEVELEDGRPVNLTFGGMDTRLLSELKVVALDRANLRLAVQLVEPDGTACPLAESKWESTDGRMVIVRNVPIDTLGDFRLFVMDRNRDKGSAKVLVSYRNPKPGHKTHKL